MLLWPWLLSCFTLCTSLCTVHRGKSDWRSYVCLLERYESSVSIRSRGMNNGRLFSSVKPLISYRNARVQDLPQVARLVSDTFSGPYALHQLLQKEKDYKSSLEQFNDRYDKFIMQRRKKHAMVVSVYDPSASMNSSDAAVVTDLCGFLELGVLPSPVPVNVSLPVGVTILATTDQPYLGNLAIDEGYRRRGIATKLIRVAEKIVEKWGDKYLFAGVDCTNEGAIAMYLRLGYKVVLDERDLINRTAKGIPRLFIMKTFAS